MLLFSLGSKRIWLCAKLTVTRGEPQYPLPLSIHPQVTQTPNGSLSSWRSVCPSPFYSTDPQYPRLCTCTTPSFLFSFQLATSQRCSSLPCSKLLTQLSTRKAFHRSRRCVAEAEIRQQEATRSEPAHVRNNLLYLAFSLLLCSAVSAQEGANNLTQPHELSK